VISETTPPSAAEWLEGFLLGAPATSIAMLAVAWVGLQMLDGRISVKRGVEVILGCFILFSAPAIIAGLRGSADDGVFAQTELRPLPSPSPSPSKTPPYDPYAGAAMPNR
jgi:hypothetical protein